MEVGFVAGGGGGDDGVLGVVAAEGVELVGDVLGGGEALFNPADLTARGADLDPAAAVGEDDELLAVGGGSGAVGDGGDAVAEVGLFGRDVDVLVGGMGAEAGAAGEEADREQEGREAMISARREELVHGNGDASAWVRDVRARECA